MTLARLGVILTVALSCLSGTASADLAFPARLQIQEREAGVYDVVFDLPVVEGRKLRAEPILPPGCTDIAPRAVTFSPTQHSTSWTVRCEPASLAGEAVLVNGLLGTQIDLALTLSTLDGRVYSRILRPSRPGFLVPDPPSLASIASEATVTGARGALRELPLWLLLAVAAFSGLKRRDLGIAAAAFALSHGLGQWLGARFWLQIAIPARDIMSLVSAAVPAAALAGAGRAWRGWLAPLWPLALLLGMLHGGARPIALPPDGLSHMEQVLAIAFYSAGAGLGFLLIAAIWSEAGSLMRLLGRTRRQRAFTASAYALGGLATGLLLTRVVAVLLVPKSVTPESLALWLLVALLGIGFGSARRGAISHVLPVPVAALLCVGGAAGLARWPLPLGSTAGTAALIFLGMAAALAKPLSWQRLAVVATVAVPAQAWMAAGTIAENSSRSTGVAAGVALVACCVLYGATSVGRLWREVPPGPGLRIFGAAVAIAAVCHRLLEYHVWYDRTLATELALGILRLPVLALVLLAAAGIVWPRRQKLLRELGLGQPRRWAHWLLVGAAWLLLPFGTVRVPIPFFDAQAPRGEAARRVVENVLDSTYRSFNIEDEDELYDRLAETVTLDMVDRIYLDSRRRLTAGTLKGAEVTVREVSVLEISEPEDVTNADPAFEYSCRWVVIARVSHLQHVHHRRNSYAGRLTLRVDGERWKIAGVELLSEDREVVAWKPV